MPRRVLALVAPLCVAAIGACYTDDSRNRPAQQPPPGYVGYPPGQGPQGQVPPGQYPGPYAQGQPAQGGYPQGGYPQQPPPVQGPPGQYPPGYGPPPQPTAAPPPAPTAPVPVPGGIAPPPLGSFDASGALTSQFIRDEPQSVLQELIGALPDAARAKVTGVPLSVIDDAKEVNAFAGCDDKSGAFMGITSPLLLFMARGSEVRSYDEIYGTAKYGEYVSGTAAEVKGGKAITGPPPGFLPAPQALDPRKLARQKFLYDEQLAYVLGHELAHHHRGHTGCAKGASSNAGAAAVGQVLAHAVPLFNQPLELEADTYGTANTLDAGAKRQGEAGPRRAPS